MPKQMVTLLMIAAAGALGALSRYGISRLFSWTTFPVGTLLINLSGAFFLGWFASIAKTRFGLSDAWFLAIGTGFVGAYTTFSTFMFESDKMLQNGEWLRATSYLLGSLSLGLLAVRLGVIVAGRP